MIMGIQAQQYQENLGCPLFSSQELMDYCGGFCDSYVNIPEQEQMPLLQDINLLKNHNLGFANSPLFSSSSFASSLSQSNPASMASSESLAAQIDKQTLEMDQYILLQSETLRLAVQEKVKYQVELLLKGMEWKTMSLLRQKDEDIARATKKTMELQECLKRVEMENQTWQKVNKENEIMLMTLNTTLEQVNKNFCSFPYAGAEEVESCCDISPEYYREEEEEEEENEEEPMRNMACKACSSEKSSFLFLPCRHLCSCRSCETFLDCCPVCNSPKKASVEVLMV